MAAQRTKKDGGRRGQAATELIGYARVSTDEQTTDPQIDALAAAGCRTIFRENASGGDRSRAELAKTIERCGPGTILVVVRIDRLARSLSHLLEIIERLEAQGSGFRSLGDPIDTTSPQGRFTLQILGAVAEFERALIRERTLAGMRAARERGSLPGNPGLRARSPATLRVIHAAQEARRDANLLRVADDILPLLRELRPAQPWDVVARLLDKRGCKRPDGGAWSRQALARAARRLARDGFLPSDALARTRRRRDNDDLVTLVALAARSLPNPTLAAIAKHLEETRCRTARGELHWSTSTVRNYLDQAVALGILPERPAPAPDAPRRRGRPAKVRADAR